MSALAEFERLEGGLEQARERLQEAQARRRDAAVDLEAAERELQEHVAAVVAGEREADDEHLDALYTRVRDRQALVSVRLLNFGQTSEAQVVDLRGEAEVAGAQRAVEAAEAALRDYARVHVAELAAELATGPSAEVGREALAAIAASRRASARWNAVYTRWADVLRQADALDELQSIPVNPFGELTAGEEVVSGPVPGSLR